MTDETTDVKEDEYDRLPASIKGIYTRKEYLWLSDREKRDLIQRECEPECE